MDMEIPLEPGQKCWMFWHGILSQVKIVEQVSQGGYRFTFETGCRKGETDIKIREALYRFPDDKTTLITDIDREIETLMMYKSMVILEKALP